MELITNILSEYLKHNKRLIVPKLGAFIVKQPSGIIRFTELIRSDDGVLRSLLIAYGVKELEASGMIDRFVFEIRHAVNQGEVYNIEGLGEFSRGDNNTILFKHKQEPKTYGGKIKPPVETLDLEKIRFLRSIGRDINVVHTMVDNENTKPRRDSRKKQDEDTGSIVKPDAYLRGLNYDKKKKKRRGEEHTEVKRGSGVRPFVTILTLATLAIVIVWGVWQWRGGYGIKFQNNEIITSVANSEDIDTAYYNSIDTINVDTTTIITDEPKDISTGNSYLNPHF